MQPIYLDNNATTQPADSVLKKMEYAQKNLWANPSSVHRFGQKTRQQIELARNEVALLIGAKPAQIIFTSGGTESNNLAIKGLLENNLYKNSLFQAALITSKIEHAAVSQPALELANRGGVIINLPLDNNGKINPGDVTQNLLELAKNQSSQEDAKPVIALVSIQWANNEIGVIQPIKKISTAIKKTRIEITKLKINNPPKIYFHVDGTQAVGKLEVDVEDSGIDFLSFSGHKFHGPKASGALYIRQGISLQSVNSGGPQEREKRGGTENSIGIIGLGEAAKLAKQFLQDKQRLENLEQLRNYFEQQITKQIKCAKINCHSADRLWNTSNIAFDGLDGEAILLNLSERGIYASAGAACSSGSLEPSPVLLAIGLDSKLAQGSVRFSLSRQTTKQEIDSAIEKIVTVIKKIETMRLQ